ncbi:Hypothetical predicted protein [Prunus dulcis]|uniref:Uncharacterized protein n=1 Tax=Prunus dulcis TaxID=3755 RepID=A0A5E4FMK8_PRUDU|nr:Hypothetical predicted protein [Prunus dulcis]
MAWDDDAVAMVDMVNLCCDWRREKAVVVGGSAGSWLFFAVGCRRHCLLRERALRCNVTSEGFGTICPPFPHRFP